MARRVAVLGAGSWGTALAMLLQRQGVPTLLWGRDPDAIAAMRESGQNRRYLPDLPLPDGLELSSDLEAAAASAELLLLVTPSHAFAEVLKRFDLGKGTLLVTPGNDRNLTLAARNIREVQLTTADALNTYEVLRPRKLLFTRSAFEQIEKRLKD